MDENDFDRLVEALQEEVDQKDQADFSDYALFLSQNPYNFLSVPPAAFTVHHAETGPCGDTVTWYLTVKDGLLLVPSYTADACSTSIIAFSQIAKMVENQSVEFAQSLSQERVLEALQKYPAANHHCIRLGLNGLNKAIEKYQSTESSFK